LRDALTPPLSHREREKIVPVGPRKRSAAGHYTVRPDALTPALSHRERENT